MKILFEKFFYLNHSEKLIILFSILGLIPFIIGLVDLLIFKENLIFLINIPKYYGSIILTFLGAIYWGIVLKQPVNNTLSMKFSVFLIIWSILPSTLAILILATKHNLSIIILASSFFLCQIIDEICVKKLKFPNWYIFLRRFLTTSVIIILICSYLLIND